MKALKGNGIIICIIEVLVGILLLANPVGFTKSIIISAGIVLMANGLFNVIRYFKSKPEEAAVSQLLMRGLIALLAGWFCAFNPRWFIVAFPVIAILYGVAILVGGMSKVQTAMDMFRMKNKKWWWGAVSAAISIICALIIINNPFSSSVVLWQFAGITLIVEGIFDGVAMVMSRKSGEGTKA